MRRAVLTLFAGAALAAACGSFASEETSPTAPDRSDASNAPEASNDAAPVIDAPTLDGSPDAAVPFCGDANAHDLCEDFDQKTLAADNWQAGRQSTPDAGLAQLDPGQSTSPPLSLLVGMSTKGFNVQRSFFLHRNITKAATKKVVIAFDLYVDTLAKLDAATNADSLVMTFGDGVYSNQIRVANASGQLTVSVIETSMGNGYTDPTFTFGANTLAVQRWHRFVLSVDHVDRLITLSIDGSFGTAEPPTLWHVPAGSMPNLGLELGSQSDQSGETIKTYFDNVTVDIDR